MGHQSVISGYIKLTGSHHIDQTRETISSFPFDEVWPFSNIFWCDSPAIYHGNVIAFAGSYKQIEEVWSEWLWKFSQLLQQLEAEDAYVHLDCIIGNYSWRLLPKPLHDWNASLDTNTRVSPIPQSMIGQPWGIVEAPDDDFSIDPIWIASIESNLATLNKDTGEYIPYHWTRQVPRWLLPGQ